MQITATMVKELRERTGAGMMECKQVLAANDGDIEAAIENMRKSGQAKADKKAARIAAEGTIAIALSEDDRQAAIVEVNCETDFVVKDDQFQAFAQQLANVVLRDGIDTVEQLNAAVLKSGQSVEQTRLNLITKIGENIQVRRFEKNNSTETIASYAHGSRIGVLVELAGADTEVGRDIAMHIAASKPICVAEADVPAHLLEKEKEIFMAQAQSSNKPAEIIAKIAQGKLAKHLKEITLLGQPFVKDPDQTVADLLTGVNASVLGFVRYEVGEGLEKRSEKFADEVMEQVKQSQTERNKDS